MAGNKTLRETLEYCMANESALVLAIDETKHEGRRQGGGRKSGVSKPTEAAAIWNLSSVGPVLVNNFFLVEKPERTLSAIRHTKAHFFYDRKYGEVYRARFLSPKAERWQEIPERLGMPKTTYYDHINKILDYAENAWENIRCWD